MSVEAIILHKVIQERVRNYLNGLGVVSLTNTKLSQILSTKGSFQNCLQYAVQRDKEIRPNDALAAKFLLQEHGGAIMQFQAEYDALYNHIQNLKNKNATQIYQNFVTPFLDKRLQPASRDITL